MPLFLLVDLVRVSVGGINFSRTPRRASASIALHAGPIPHQREVAALRAHLALVAFGLRLGAPLRLGRDMRHCGGAGLAPLHGLELLGRREVVAGLLLQGDRAFDRIAGAAVAG